MGSNRRVSGGWFHVLDGAFARLAYDGAVVGIRNIVVILIERNLHQALAAAAQTIPEDRFRAKVPPAQALDKLQSRVRRFSRIEVWRETRPVVGYFQDSSVVFADQ